MQAKDIRKQQKTVQLVVATKTLKKDMSKI